jgi:hypothetical protein
VIETILGYMAKHVEEILTLGPSETKGVFKQHSIAVVLHSKKVSLYIDGQNVDSSKVYWWPKKDVALLRGSIKDSDKRHVVEVYGISGLRRARIKLCVDGERIAGDAF